MALEPNCDGFSAKLLRFGLTTLSKLCSSAHNWAGSFARYLELGHTERDEARDNVRSRSYGVPARRERRLVPTCGCGLVL